MSFFRSVISLSLTLALASGCASDPSSPNVVPPARIGALPRPLTGAEQSLVGANADFSSRLFQTISSAKRDANVFISPLSASMALGMTMNGAAGTSFDEMRRTLGFGSLTRDEILRSHRDLISLLRGLDEKVDFRIANVMWWRDSFAPSINPTFVSDAKDYFGASAQGADFSQPAAIAAINAWVKSNTNGKITSIVDALDSEIVLFLANAIYFKGDWREGFTKGATKNAPFMTSTGATVQVPTMQRTATTRLGGEGGRIVVELGYGGDAFAMTVVLPAVGENIDALVSALTPNEWKTQLASLHDTEVELSMPKFTMSWERELKADLSAMGMPTPFVPGRSAFSGISSTRGHDLFISFVKQKTFVDVNEVGTEAAAVTGVGVGVTSAPQRVAIHVDRPFVFAIRERLSGTILFIGKIVNPAALAP